MNIRNRIQKLENGTGMNSASCTCKERRHGFADVFVVSDDFDVSDTSMDEATKVRYCETCKKEIDKVIITINTVDGMSELEDDQLATIVTGDSRAKASDLSDDQLRATLQGHNG